MAVHVNSSKPGVWCSDATCMTPAWLTVGADGDDGAPVPAYCVDDAEKLILAARDRGGDIGVSEAANRVLAIEGVDL